jgi:ABC-type methionine transport system permease subunit
MNGRQAHRAGTLVLSVLMMGIGVALIGQAIGQNASPISPRMLLGVLFVAAGVARTYLEVKKGRGA